MSSDYMEAELPCWAYEEVDDAIDNAVELLAGEDATDEELEEIEDAIYYQCGTRERLAHMNYDNGVLFNQWLWAGAAIIQGEME